jgi:ubiquinone/menaquinone biosynthesis C-methylase UbiE
MNNHWNQFIYKLWAPIYDLIFNKGSFFRARQKVFDDLVLKERQNLLLVGVGTGADIEFITRQQVDFTMVGIDLSRDMLQRASEKFQDSRVKFEQMDAQSLTFKDGTFDVVIASLIVAVVPDAKSCLAEIVRVTRSEGEIIIFDKFVPTDRQLSFLKKVLRPIIRRLGTDIGLRFEEILQPYMEQVEIVQDMPVLFNGMYRKIVLRKKG